ncbi:hypothetical protein [Inhella sp.]|uniref:hypothetical protein n=1 Tax=Inhella sp. TaxID=1921806 RepID=UPI0035B46858
MQKHAAQRLSALLVILGIGQALRAILTGLPLLPAMLWPAMFVALGLSSIFGSRPAAKALGYMLAVGAALNLLALLAGPVPLLGLIVSVVWSLCALYTARFLFRVTAQISETDPGSPS